MKRKGPKIIQINGFRGIFFAAFIVVCLFAGFALFPAKVAEYLWNYIASNYIAIPKISLWQGLLLWAMVAISIYILNNKTLAVSFHQQTELSDDEMQFLMKRIQMQNNAQKLNAMILNSKEFKALDKEIEEKMNVSSSVGTSSEDTQNDKDS